MSILLDKQITVNRIAAISVEHARAMGDSTRAEIMWLLHEQPMAAEHIKNALDKSGYDKALTTVRHHMDVLKRSGLIEVVKIEEARGFVRKYYSTSTKMLDFKLPEDFESKYSKVVEKTAVRIEKILKGLPVKAEKTKNKKSEEYIQYLAVEIMNRAVTSVLESTRRPRSSSK